jgi:succinate dehydrogenase flavin-adding protein (antitoxin of CptAB toxin-antitoxin module)
MASKDKAVASETPNQDAQTADAVGKYIAGIFANNDTGNTARSGTSTDTKVTRLTYQTAKGLLEKVMAEANFMGKLSTDDIKNFLALFTQAQDAQIEKVVTTSSSKTTKGATADAASQVVESTKKQEFPSFFDPAEFARDFIWQKINFKDEASLGAKSLDALGQVRGLVKNFQLLGVTDNDIRNAAKQIAMGKKTIDAYKIELQQIAKKEYPQFADRFTTDPTLTTYDIASPIVKMLAKTWEMDEKDISMDDPIVMSYMHYAGADGKGQQPSRYDLLLKAKADRKYQSTQEANENARDAATGLARAFGFGV